MPQIKNWYTYNTRGPSDIAHLWFRISVLLTFFQRKILLTSFCVRNACKLHKPIHQNTVFKQKYNDVWYSRKNTLNQNSSNLEYTLSQYFHIWRTVLLISHNGT